MISIKLYIDTKGERVLFAEATSKDFVDFLMHVLSLPLATASRLVKGHGQGTVGSISSLYSSVEGLNNRYILPKQSKDSILYPQLFHENNYNSYVPPFWPKMWVSLYEKQSYKCCHCNYVCDDNSLHCPDHKKKNMHSSVIFVTSPSLDSLKEKRNSSSWDSSYEGGFVKGIVTYIVMDNLEVKPMLDMSVMKRLVDQFNVDFASLEERVVNMGTTEAVMLLKTSLQSQTVLTDVFLKSMESKQ